jgi:enoyl-CoA hydratase/methylglutaconyl-CoA hydratase
MPGMADTPADELVHLDVEGPLATITLDSPHNRNALSRRLVTELRTHLDTVAEDGDVRVVLLRSSGRVFCSGADMSEATEGGMEEGARAIVALQRLLLTLPQAVVVELGGPVRAGGIGIVAAADVVLAADDATFALTEVKLGLAAAIISLSVFPRMTPRGGSWAALSGEVFTAADAVTTGLVTRAVPAADLGEEVRRSVAALATGAAQGLRETKRLLNRDVVADIDARGEELAALSASLFASDEAKAAMTAFLSRGR